jgi:hypothetical protein
VHHRVHPLVHQTGQCLQEGLVARRRKRKERAALGHSAETRADSPCAAPSQPKAGDTPSPAGPHARQRGAAAAPRCWRCVWETGHWAAPRALHGLAGPGRSSAAASPQAAPVRPACAWWSGTRSRESSREGAVSCAHGPASASLARPPPMLHSMWARRARDGAPLLRWLAGFGALCVAVAYLLRGAGWSRALQPVHVQARALAWHPRVALPLGCPALRRCVSLPAPSCPFTCRHPPQPGKLHVLVTVRPRNAWGSHTRTHTRCTHMSCSLLLSPCELPCGLCPHL